MATTTISAITLIATMRARMRVMVTVVMTVARTVRMKVRTRMWTTLSMRATVGDASIVIYSLGRLINA